MKKYKWQTGDTTLVLSAVDENVPGLSDIHAACQAGNWQQAEADCALLRHQYPDDADVFYLSSYISSHEGRLDEASEYLRHSLQINPEIAERHLDQGALFELQGNPEDAHACYQRALELNPDLDAAHINLGNLFKSQGDYAQAVIHYQHALRLAPDSAVAYNSLGVTLQDLNRPDDAMTCFEHAVRLQPQYAEALSNLGSAFQSRGDSVSALKYYEQAIAADETLADAYYNKGNALYSLGRLDQACRSYETALNYPGIIEKTCNGLGLVCYAQGDIQGAVRHFKMALSSNPGFIDAHTNLLLSLNYASDYDSQSVFREHRRWAENHAQELAGSEGFSALEYQLGRRLRIGYVSGDLRFHPVAFFIEPILQAHTGEDIEVTCYSDVTKPDTTTERLRSLSDHWRDISAMTDKQVAEAVRADRMDILVDLAGHTSATRMLVFARKPAPVQVSYLGYPNTTGLSTIDYRFTDELADPEQETAAFYVEKLVRLRPLFCCYRPPEDAPEVSKLPAKDYGAITFASFNTLAKITPEVIAAWAEILKAVPSSRLLLQAWALKDSSTRERIKSLFAAHDISPHRIKMLKNMPFADHLALYGRVDMALDTFPWSGHTTLCHALWMGVPVVTLKGGRHASRMGASVLDSLGLQALIADTREQYVSIVKELASDERRLDELRQSMRQRMTQSPLLDANHFVQELELAYFKMWKDACA